MTRPGPGFAEILDQGLDVVGAAVLGEIVGEVVVHSERGAHLGKSPGDCEADTSSATHSGHERRSSIQREVGGHV